MSNRDKNLYWLMTSLVIFVSSLVGYVYYTYYQTHHQLMTKIDERLLHAANSINFILGQNYHNQLTETPPTQEQYLAIAKTLSNFAEQIDVEYVYTMILKNGKVQFTSSSYTNRDLNDDKLTYLFDEYPEATQLNINAFYSTEPVFEYSKDQWGHFKSIFVPFQTIDGTTYLAGADITINDVETQVSKSVTQAAITACFFFFIAALLAAVYVFILKRSLITDPATGCANNVGLDLAITNSSQLHQQLTLVQIDEYEELNSFYGSNIGDKLVCELVKHITLATTNKHQVFRIASDTVAVLNDDLHFDQQLESVIKRFNNDHPLLADPQIYVSLYMGIAKGNKHLLIENALVALQQAKQKGLALVLYCDKLSSIKSEHNNNVAQIKMLRNAFENDLFVPYFQTIWNTQSCKPHLYEVLTRVISNHQVISAESFFHVISRTKMENKLTREMLGKAVAQFRETNLSWSINISEQVILDSNTQQLLTNELQRYPKPNNIVFEIDTAAADRYFEQTKLFISSMRKLGAQVYLDEFGLQFGSLNHLTLLRPDGVKLAKQLAQDIHKQPLLKSWLARLVSFAGELNILVVAKCVDNKLQLDILEEAGITLAQGYYFSPPSAHPDEALTAAHKMLPLQQQSIANQEFRMVKASVTS